MKRKRCLVTRAVRAFFPALMFAHIACNGGNSDIHQEPECSPPMKHPERVCWEEKGIYDYLNPDNVRCRRPDSSTDHRCTECIENSDCPSGYHCRSARTCVSNIRPEDMGKDATDDAASDLDAGDG